MLAGSLYELMDERGITQAMLAQKTGLHWQQIHKMLRGETANPRLDTLVKLADSLDVSLDELVGRAKLK